MTVFLRLQGAIHVAPSRHDGTHHSPNLSRTVRRDAGRLFTSIQDFHLGGMTPLLTIHKTNKHGRTLGWLVLAIPPPPSLVDFCTGVANEVAQ